MQNTASVPCTYASDTCVQEAQVEEPDVQTCNVAIAQLTQTAEEPTIQAPEDMPQVAPEQASAAATKDVQLEVTAPATSAEPQLAHEPQQAQQAQQAALNVLQELQLDVAAPVASAEAQPAQQAQLALQIHEGQHAQQAQHAQQDVAKDAEEISPAVKNVVKADTPIAQSERRTDLLDDIEMPALEPFPDTVARPLLTVVTGKTVQASALARQAKQQAQAATHLEQAVAGTADAASQKDQQASPVVTAAQWIGLILNHVMGTQEDQTLNVTAAAEPQQVPPTAQHAQQGSQAQTSRFNQAKHARRRENEARKKSKAAGSGKPKQAVLADTLKAADVQPDMQQQTVLSASCVLVRYALLSIALCFLALDCTLCISHGQGQTIYHVCLRVNRWWCIHQPICMRLLCGLQLRYVPNVLSYRVSKLLIHAEALISLTNCQACTNLPNLVLCGHLCTNVDSYKRTHVPT